MDDYLPGEASLISLTPVHLVVVGLLPCVIATRRKLIAMLLFLFPSVRPSIGQVQVGWRHDKRTSRLMFARRTMRLTSGIHVASKLLLLVLINRLLCQCSPCRYAFAAAAAVNYVGFGAWWQESGSRLSGVCFAGRAPFYGTGYYVRHLACPVSQATE